MAIALFVGLLRLVTGPRFAGPWGPFVNGCLVDLVLPLSLYLLLPSFGRTFDPSDMVMYGSGVLGGALLEARVLSRVTRCSQGLPERKVRDDAQHQKEVTHESVSESGVSGHADVPLRR